MTILLQLMTQISQRILSIQGITRTVLSVDNIKAKLLAQGYVNIDVRKRTIYMERNNDIVSVSRELVSSDAGMMHFIEAQSALVNENSNNPRR